MGGQRRKEQGKLVEWDMLVDLGGGGGSGHGQHAGSKVPHDEFVLDMEVLEHGVQAPVPQ